MTPTQQALAKKLADPARREKLIAAIERGEPAWVAGFTEPQADVEEVLREQRD